MALHLNKVSNVKDEDRIQPEQTSLIWFEVERNDLDVEEFGEGVALFTYKCSNAAH